MPFSESVLSRIVRCGLPILTALLALCSTYQPSAAAEKNTFVIDGLEGYGISDCLSEGGSCGKIVADAWCEAHGLGPAVAFGRAEDVTASVPKDGAPSLGVPQGAETAPSSTKTAESAISDNRSGRKHESMVVRCAD